MLTCFFPNTWAFILCIFSGYKVNCISVLLWVTPNAPQQRSLYVSCRGEHSLFLDESTVLCRATSLSPDSQFLTFMSPPQGVYDQVLYLSHDYKKQSIWGILSYLCLPLSCLCNILWMACLLWALTKSVWLLQRQMTFQKVHCGHHQLSQSL